MDERIKVKAENGQLLDVLVYDKRADRIQVVLGEGPHSVKADLDRLNPAMKKDYRR